MYHSAVAFTAASEDIDINEDGGTGMVCVALVDDDNGGGGITAAITVDLMQQTVGGTNPTGTCWFYGV